MKVFRRMLSAQPVFWRDTVEFFLVDHRQEDNYQPKLLTEDTIDQFSFQPQPEGFGWGEPSFTLETGAAQQFFDELWRQGFRPSRQINEVSRLEATQNHLADMRAIVFSKLNIPSPELPKKGTLE